MNTLLWRIKNITDTWICIVVSHDLPGYLFEGNILDVMWLSEKGKGRLDVGREVAFRDANTELNAAKQGDW